MIIFLWSYLVVVWSIQVTFQIIAWAFRLFIVAPIQAISATLIFLVVCGIYASTWLTLGAIFIFALIYFAFNRVQRQRGQANDRSISLFGFLASKGINRTQVQKFIGSKNIRIRNKNNGNTFHPSTEICRLWPGDIVIINSQLTETKYEFIPGEMALTNSGVEERRQRWLAEQESKTKPFTEET